MARSGKNGPIKPAATPSTPTTGIWPWWTYQARSVPGVGDAMVNVGNFNLLLDEDDVDIPEGGVELAFHRVYNSQSLHDAAGDDGSTPSVFGNRWTNNLDAHLAASGSGSTLTISVYTGDGARDDYTCDVTENPSVCTSNQAGIYDILAPNFASTGTGGVACQFQWTKKSGISYMFNAPYTGCSFGAGSEGRLLQIYGRNMNFSVALSYAWSPDDSEWYNLQKITATHEPDGNKLVLTFNEVSTNPPITELSQLSLPNGQSFYYFYDSGGDLEELSKPGNNPVLVNETMPSTFADGNPIAQGNLPELYDVSNGQLLEACGPRATIAILNNASNPPDGACVDFTYSASSPTDLAAWETYGVLNPKPQDGVGTPSPIQSGQTGFVTSGNTTFFDPVIQLCETTEMNDSYGHSAQWCWDKSWRVLTSAVEVSSSGSGTWLTTGQTWDDNNDLTSVTDARYYVNDSGNYATNIAYDANGNPIEISLPSQTTNQGTVRPTTLIDYDDYNNVLDYCDPANNADNNWVPSPSPSPCANSGSASYTKLQYGFNDSNEAYGCLKYVYAPSSYETMITYPSGEPCGSGLPYEILGNGGNGILQLDHSTRQPTEKFTYNTDGSGTLVGYGIGNGSWTINYATNDVSNNMYWVASVSDPDGVTSYQCHNQDGSVFFNESGQQDNLDFQGQGPGCPGLSSLEGGTATPPPYATAYTYDPDGDVATELNHHNCPSSSGACAADSPAATNCNGISVPAGTTCKFYDGLDRLVEVKLPYDSSVDLYHNPWITRYLYDLTGSTYSFQGASIAGYGNLFETEELLPSTANAGVSGEPTPGSISNNTYSVIKAISYDGGDRPVVKYSPTGASTSNTETLTWDTSPLDSDVAGFLGEDCNSVSPSQCQEFDYTPDGQLMSYSSSGPAPTSPPRGYTYDPDGRATKITQSGRSSPQTYGYDVDGNLTSSEDASASTGSQASLTYERYIDGTLKQLDVSSGSVLNKTGLFQYSYRNDGALQTEVLNHASNPTLAYNYTNAGRLTTETGNGPTTCSNNTTTISITYNATTGLMQQECTPLTAQATLSNPSYSAESELVSVQAPTPQPNGCGGGAYSYSLRGELTSQPNCGTNTGQTFLANGVSFRTPSNDLQAGSSYGWNDLMAAMNIAMPCLPPHSACTSSSWQYDAAGRMNSESAAWSQNLSGYPTTTQRVYDTENHLTSTTINAVSTPNPSPSPTLTEEVNWGPDGHPITIGTSIGGGAVSKERLHWLGNQLLFTTHLNQSQNEVLDDIKIGTEGDDLPVDQVPGVTFYDRGPGGLLLGCAHGSNTAYLGITDTWMSVQGATCSQGGNMPVSTMYSGSPYNIAGTSGYFIGAPNSQYPGTIGMPRPDGITDGFDTLQGVRAYDSMSNQWTTPDAYEGSIEDPTSEKSYAWSNNNPVGYGDPSGYFSCQGCTIPTQWPDPDTGPSYLDLLFLASTTTPLKIIATVVAHRQSSSALIAEVFSCKPACMYAPLKGKAKQRCDQDIQSLSYYGETYNDVLKELGGSIESAPSGRAKPKSLSSYVSGEPDAEVDAEAEGIEAAASAPGMLNEYWFLYQMAFGSLPKEVQSANNAVARDCMNPVTT